MTEAVPTRFLRVCFNERLMWTPFVQVRIYYLYDTASAGRRGFEFYQSHYFVSPAAKLISWPGLRQIYAFFQLRLRPKRPPKRFFLPLTLAT